MVDIKGAALAKQLDDRRNLLRYPNGPLSPAAPIIATEDTFDTNSMANLSNVTDGSLSTYAGTGTKTLGGGGVIGNLKFDLGSVKNVSLNYKIGAWSSASNIRIYLAVSEDNSVWSPGINDNIRSTIPTNETELIVNNGGINLIGRYIKLIFYLQTAGTGNVKAYSVKAFDQGE